MIEIQLFDGTTLQFPEGTSQDVIDRVARQETMTRREAGTSMQGAPDAEADQNIMQRVGSALYENVIGSGEVDTPGERLGEFIRGGTAATARGIADVPAIPANLAQLGAMGVERILGMDEPSAVSRGLASLPDTREMLASIPVIGAESEYVAPGTAGEYISTAGEFAGGAGLLAGPSAALRYGALPGVVSEAAGQATEGTAIEPYARTAAAIGTSLLAAPRPGAFSGADESARMANVLERAGVRNITAGQARGNRTLMAAEGRLQATPQQIDDFTASTMRQLGSADDIATPANLAAVERRLVQDMADATAGATIRPSVNQANAAVRLAADYVERVPQGQLTPRVRGIANEIKALAVSGRDVPLERLRSWRSDIGSMTVSPDAATRQAAQSLRGLIDDLTDTALNAANRTDDIQRLAQARESYRNFIAVRDAASRAGAEGGTLSPQQLNQSMIRSQGREAYATGRTTDMADFTRAGAATLRPAPAVNPGGIRAVQGSSVGLGGALGTYVGGIPGAVIGAGAGMAAPVVGQAAMRSNAMQTLLRDPYAIPRQSVPMLPGLLSQN